MRDEEIDPEFDDIVPSSGFTASVMDAVTREATAPPPIPFPWKRALPGLIWCLAVNIGFLMIFLRRHATPSSIPGAVVPSTVMSGVAWVAAALLLSLVSIALSTRIAKRV
jgi:hypothetical protein